MYKKIIEKIIKFYKDDTTEAIGMTMIVVGVAIVLIAILVGLFLWHWVACLIGFAILIAITGGVMMDF